MWTCLSLLICFFEILACVQSYSLCGKWQCYGYSYCCGTNEDECCYYTPVFKFWWFWIIWAILFLIMASCSYLFWRRRHQPLFIIKRLPAQREVITTEVNYPPQSQLYAFDNNTITQLSVSPPAYLEKPPDYVP